MGTTKNDEPRTAPLTDSVYLLLRELVHGKQANDYLFTRANGKRVSDFRGTWYKACCRAEVGKMFCKPCGLAVDLNRHCNGCGKTWAWNKLRYSGLLFHELRRTGVRNMVRAGIPERVAMTISGHKTRSVFDRYDIVSARDREDAARKMEARDCACETPAVSTAVAPEAGHVENRPTLQ